MTKEKTETKEKFWNIPNVLSLYRLCSFPLLVYFIITQSENLFIGFLIANLITDILDGLIARTFNMQTTIGAKLDSYADVGSFVLAVWGIRVFRWEGFAQNPWPFLIFISLYVLSMIYIFLKYRGIAGFHMYSFKILGYVQGVFLGITFLFEFYKGFYLFAMIAGIIVCLEEIAVTFVLPKPRQNVKGLYWVLKELNKEKL
jgi:CDP-diacylglycerol--glycerol-3-phosphate 3-phosphatidyltransferase